MAMLKRKMPGHKVSHDAPPTSSEVPTFSGEVRARQESAEDPATIRLRHLVPDISQQLSKLQSAIDQQNEANKAIPKALDSMAQTMDARMQTMDAKISALTSQMDYLWEILQAFARAMLNVTTPQEGMTSSQGPSNDRRQPNFAAQTAQANSDHPATQSIAQQPENSQRFKMCRELSNVAQAWEEWHHGLNGKPSIEEMDLKDKRWRAGPCERKFYSNRKVIINELKRLIATHGWTDDQAIHELEKQRGRKSLNGLMKVIRRERQSGSSLGEAEAVQAKESATLQEGSAGLDERPAKRRR